MILRVWSSCLQSPQSWRKLDPRKHTQQVPRSRTRLPDLPKARTQAKAQQSITVQCASNMMQNMACHAGCDMQCISVLRKGRIEPGLNLEIQVCHWKHEMKSPENDIKNARIGVTVWKCKRFKNDTGLRFTASSHLNAMRWTSYNTQTWQKNYMAGMNLGCLTKF